MKLPVKSGRELLDEIDQPAGDSVVLWWLGQSGFVIKSQDIVFYIDPCLRTNGGRERILAPPLDPAEISNAGLILATHTGATHMEPETLPAILAASPEARLVLPKSTAAHTRGLGIPYERMTTTDSDLRVEYFTRGSYGRVYAIPSAHPTLDWTPLGGYPCLGYLLRFGAVTIYHSGDCQWYDGIVDRLRPYRVTVALLPIDGERNFDSAGAAQLAEDIGVRWLVPMHYGTFAGQAVCADRFVDHMLGFHPSVGFKVFEPGERWAIPD